MIKNVPGWERQQLNLVREEQLGRANGDPSARKGTKGGKLSTLSLQGGIARQPIL